MNEECLKLTTYFGEHDRTETGLLGDELMRIYGERRVRASALLRGMEGFGRLHHLHTDRLLTLSEDLPVVSIAIDERSRIESVLDLVLQIKRRGLITLERARLLSGETVRSRLPEQHGEETKLTIYLARQQRIDRRPAYLAICETLHRHRVAGATVLLGVDGTRQGRRFRARLLGRNAGVPMILIAVGSGERIAAALAELEGMLADPLITVERVRVCKRDGRNLADPHELPGADGDGLALWQKLTVYSSAVATHDGQPLHQSIVRRLRAGDASGASSLRGIWGYHGDHAPHGDRFLQLRRHVPVCTIVIDTPERIARSFQTIDQITAEHGLVTSEIVPAMSAMSETERKGGLRLAGHHL